MRCADVLTGIDFDQHCQCFWKVCPTAGEHAEEFVVDIQSINATIKRQTGLIIFHFRFSESDLLGSEIGKIGSNDHFLEPACYFGFERLQQITL